MKYIEPYNNIQDTVVVITNHSVQDYIQDTERIIYLPRSVQSYTASCIVASYADILRLVTRSSPRTSAQRTGHIRSLAVSQSKHLCLSVQSWTLTDFDLTLQHEKFVLQMFNILTYLRVAPATADVHIILEVPATDKIHIEDRYGLAELSQTMGYTTRKTVN